MGYAAPTFLVTSIEVTVLPFLEGPTGTWLFLLMGWNQEHSLGRKMPWRAAHRGLALLLRWVGGLVQTRWLGLQRQRFPGTKTFPKSCIF